MEAAMSFERKGAPAWTIHPGEILKEEFLKPMEISGYRLAKELDVTPQRVSDILLEKTGVSAEMAIMLGKFFGMTAEFWMNLQAAYDLAKARKQLRGKLRRIKPLSNVA
jgi:addiction module HigA family antidote